MKNEVKDVSGIINNNFGFGGGRGGEGGGPVHFKCKT